MNDTLLAFISTEDAYYYVTYSPFMGIWEEHSIPSLPNLFDFDNHTPPYPAWLLIYDSLFSRVFYRLDTIEGGAALWDLQSNQLLWELTNNAFEPSPYESHVPKWSPDNAYLAIVLSVDKDREEIFVINREGEYKQVTNVSESNKFALIEAFSWSPNSRYIAFWLDERSNPNDSSLASLWVLDLTENQVTDFCLSNTDANKAPIWHPNGRQFVVESIDENNNSKIILIDITENSVAIIGDNSQVYGWMTSIP